MLTFSLPALDCGVLSNPSNGMVTAFSTTFMSVANYSCNHGYLLMGVTSRTCQADATWSDDEPTCERESWGYSCVHVVRGSCMVQSVLVYSTKQICYLYLVFVPCNIYYTHHEQQGFVMKLYCCQEIGHAFHCPLLNNLMIACHVWEPYSLCLYCTLY